MLPALCFAVLLAHSPWLSAPAEPDGSHTVGVVPPFHGQPEPPPWLRSTSHALAALRCRHYVYEAYGDALGCWLVHYRSLPERGEATWQTEQTFLFRSEWKQPEELGTREVHYHAEAASYGGHTYLLVERRDLLRSRP